MGWELEPGERGVAVGMTRIGKSTMCEELFKRFLAGGANRRCLLIDSKPRFRAAYQPNGFAVNYREWVKGAYVPNAMATTRVVDLREAFKLYRTVVLQSLTADKRQVEDFEESAAILIQAALRYSGDRHPTLVWINEYYDLLKGALAAIADRRLLKSIRAGGELNLAVLIECQRPRSIPVSTLTEATKGYIFHLEFEEDVAYLLRHGFPIQNVPTGHNFMFYERKNGGEREIKLMRLRLAA